MADKTIGELSSLAQLNDDSLIPVEQSGVASKLTGAQFKQFAVDSVLPYTTRAEAAAGNASGSASDASASAQGAAGSASDAADSASAAAASKTDADNAAALAESYAVGGTGTRTGEDTDNAKYYSEISEQEADRAHRIAIEDYTAEDFPLSSTDDTTVAEAVAPLYAPTTVSGSVVTIEDGIAGAVPEGLSIAIEPLQTGSGDPSPDNVRPIYGWDGVRVSVNGAVTDIPFGETVYGGTLDVLSGELSLTHKHFSSSQKPYWGTQWGGYPTYHCYELSPTPLIISSSVGGKGICDTYPWYPYDTSYQGLPSIWSIRSNDDYPYAFAISGSQFRFMVKDNRYSSVSSFESAVANSPFNWVYPIATPITTQLAPNPVTLISGINTITATLYNNAENLTQTANVTLTYRNDLSKLYALHNAQETELDNLNSSLAPMEATMLATTNHAAGSYLTVNGVLYKATAAIATGEALVVGTNISKTTVADELSALAALINNI